jgi:methionine--tRNA ligase beta chain
MIPIKNTIPYDTFSQIDLRVGTIKTCFKLEKSNKLYKLEVDFGELGTKQILTGLAPYYSSEELTGLQTIFVLNLEPRKMMGLESQGMIMSVGLDHDSKPLLLKINGEAVNGDGLS